jgi:hypothetical protein
MKDDLFLDMCKGALKPVNFEVLGVIVIEMPWTTSLLHTHGCHPASLEQTRAIPVWSCSRPGCRISDRYVRGQNCETSSVKPSKVISFFRSRRHFRSAVWSKSQCPRLEPKPSQQRTSQTILTEQCGLHCLQILADGRESELGKFAPALQLQNVIWQSASEI